MSILSRIVSALKGEPEPPPQVDTSAEGDRIRALQRQGMWDLAAAELERERRPDDESLERSERKLLEDLAPGFLGEIATYDSVEPSFHFGFLRRLWIGAEDTDVDAATILERFLEVPERHYLRNLAVGLSYAHEAYYAGVIDVLAKHGRELTRLRSLHLGDMDYQTSWIWTCPRTAWTTPR